jgi:hypothetical protein
MVIGGCLTMDEAYHSIEWKAVFLVAGMLPLGIAMEKTGTARIPGAADGRPCGQTWGRWRCWPGFTS